MTRTVTLTLSKLAGQVEREMVEYADALAPGDETRKIIVDERGGIVDGYHRVAGMVRWARESGRDLAAVQVSAVTSDDADLLAVAAEPGNGQAAALDAIRREETRR